MIVVGRDVLEAAKKKHVDAKKALDNWLQIMESCTANNFNELKNKTYRSVDFIGHNITIFDIKGNTFRLATKIDYMLSVVKIERFMTHPEYMRWLKAI